MYAVHGFRCLAVFLFVIIGIACVARAAEPSFHVRATTAQLADLFEEGQRRSTTFRLLVQQLEATDVIAHYECGWLGSSRDGQLLFVIKSGGFRYVRIQLNCALPRIELVAMLAHEIQHAVEVAQASEIVDDRSMETHYERCGDRGVDGRAYDSAAAVAAGVRVLEQLLVTRMQAKS